MANTVIFTKTLAAASANNIALAQAASAGTPMTLNGAAVSGGVATIDTYSLSNNTEPGRRVLLTSTSAVETASVTIVGTNSSQSAISETVTFSGAATTAQSNLDFVTVTQLLPSGTIVGNLSAGTNGVGSSRWCVWNIVGNPPENLGIAIELVSGAVNYTAQYTFDNPNFLPTGLSFPTPFNHPALTTQTSTADGTISTPVVATRILINSGTGVLRVRFVQAGVG